MTNPHKAKGDQWERQVRDLFIANGVTAERIPAGASADMGDLWVPGLAAVQCKNHKRLSLGPWLDETVVQQERSGKPWHWLPSSVGASPTRSGSSPCASSPRPCG